jgi:hypothetical protein
MLYHSIREELRNLNILGSIKTTEDSLIYYYIFATYYPEISFLFVKQTPEQLDAYLSECYLTVI